jgi:hypothetical protein
MVIDIIDSKLSIRELQRKYKKIPIKREYKPFKVRRGFKTLYMIQKGSCFFCKTYLLYDSYFTHIHHINGDHKDNRMRNRALVHRECHSILHLGKSGYG